MEVMDRTISLNLSTSSSTIDPNAATNNETGLPQDELWLVEVDTRNQSAITGVKSDGLSASANYSLFLVNYTGVDAGQLFQTILQHSNIRAPELPANMSELLQACSEQGLAATGSQSPDGSAGSSAQQSRGGR